MTKIFLLSCFLSFYIQQKPGAKLLPFLRLLLFKKSESQDFYRRKRRERRMFQIFRLEFNATESR